MKVNEEQAQAVIGLRQWISKRVLDIRTSRGFSQRDVANRLEVDETRVADFEASRSDYKISTVLRFCRALNISVDVLMRGCPGWTKAASKGSSSMVIMEGSALHSLLVSQGVSEKKAAEIVSQASARE
jgi:transcriptional regulator with XRE-family HTH domain